MQVPDYQGRGPQATEDMHFCTYCFQSTKTEGVKLLTWIHPLKQPSQELQNILKVLVRHELAKIIKHGKHILIFLLSNLIKKRKSK